MTTLASITQTITDGVVAHGVTGTFLLMAIDALMPVGGELVMVVAGAIAAGALGSAPALMGRDLALGGQTYAVLAVSGILGSLVGAWVGWLAGARVGRHTLERHARFLHLGHGRLQRAERWFARHGAWAVLLGRLTPLVRSFISIPAGLFGEPLGRYSALTAVASAIWCFGFAALGWALGTRYGSIDHAFHLIEAAVVAGILVVIAAAVLRRLRTDRA